MTKIVFGIIIGGLIGYAGATQMYLEKEIDMFDLADAIEEREKLRECSKTNLGQCLSDHDEKLMVSEYCYAKQKGDCPSEEGQILQCEVCYNTDYTSTKTTACPKQEIIECIPDQEIDDALNEAYEFGREQGETDANTRNNMYNQIENEK